MALPSPYDLSDPYSSSANPYFRRANQQQMAAIAPGTPGYPPMENPFPPPRPQEAPQQPPGALKTMTIQPAVGPPPASGGPSLAPNIAPQQPSPSPASPMTLPPPQIPGASTPPLPPSGGAPGATGATQPAPGANPTGAPPAATPPSSTALSSSNDLINRIYGLLNKDSEEKAKEKSMGELKGIVDQMTKASTPTLRPIDESGLQVPDPMTTLMRMRSMQPRYAYGGPVGFARGGVLRLMRGGYPLQYLEGRPGLPLRSPYARGDFVPPSAGRSGRSDDIEARLSPGEFVFDAETTSLLGDGNSEAGARKLESLRQNIRTHKGRALARGDFSPDAKPSAEAYMHAHRRGHR